MRIVAFDESSSNIETIENYISLFEPSSKIYQYTTSFAFVTAVVDEFKGDVDCIMIYLKEKDYESIRMAKDIQDYFPHIKLIFYSESGNFADKIFIASPDFFIKIPFKEKKIKEAFDRVGRYIKQDSKNSISIHNSGKLFKIKYDMISHIESVARKMMIYTLAGSYEVYMKVDEMLSLLPDNFIRCHRSYIINTDMIDSVEEDGIYLINDEFVPVSRQNQKLIKNIVKKG